MTESVLIFEEIKQHNLGYRRDMY